MLPASRSAAATTACHELAAAAGHAGAELAQFHASTASVNWLHTAVPLSWAVRWTGLFVACVHGPCRTATAQPQQRCTTQVSNSARGTHHEQTQVHPGSSGLNRTPVCPWVKRHRLQLWMAPADTNRWPVHQQASHRPTLPGSLVGDLSFGSDLTPLRLALMLAAGNATTVYGQQYPP